MLALTKPIDLDFVGLHFLGSINPREELERFSGNPNTYSANHFLKVLMPCGYSVEYQSIDDVPMINTPCPCGRANHWIVKIEGLK